jgi:putative NADH-flavin reductase
MTDRPAKTIAVIGASGGTGAQVVAQALARGWAVHALVRSAEKAAGLPAGAVATIGDARDPATLGALLAGCDAVVDCIGYKRGGPKTICADATAALLPAMRDGGVMRLVLLTGSMVAHPNLGRFYRVIVALMPRSLKAFLEDRRAQEKLVMESDRAWTILRPPRLRDGEVTGQYRSGEMLFIGRGAEIRRADLAHAMLSALMDDGTIGRAFALCY